MENGFLNLSEEIKTCPFVPGTIEFLERYYDKFKMIVVSATPHEELKFLIENRKLQKYFSEIYGSPTKKQRLYQK